MEYKEGFLSEHFHEVVHYGQKLFDWVGEAGGHPECNIDVLNIIEMERQGYFFSSKAIEDGKLLGFVGGYKFPHMHHKGIIYACTDIMYVDESLGKNRVSVLKKLISKWEDIAKEKHKVQYIQVNVNVNNDIRKLIERLGYVHTDYTMTKRI